jgi:hypothetical protein
LVYHDYYHEISAGTGNETEETGLKVFQALQRLLPEFEPVAYMGDGAFPYRNAFASVYGSLEGDKEQTMCFAHVYKVFVMNQLYIYFRNNIL